MAKFCTYCGKEVGEKDNVCGNCGKVINNTSNTTIIQVNNSNKTDGCATAGFILSILSLFCCGSTSIIGLILSIIGLVNCNKTNKDGKGLAIAGIIINSIFLIMFVLLYTFGFIAGLTEEINSL